MTERIGWMMRRLLLMSPAEVLYRLSRNVRMLVERRHLPHSPLEFTLRRVRGDEFTPVPWLAYLSDRAGVQAEVMDRYQWDPAVADRSLAHEFSFFALNRVNFGREIQWNRDYRNGVDTPMRYGPTLDYRNQKLCGDIKYAWEHNRHHHLVEIAKAAYLTGESRYEREVVDQILSWIEACPYPFGINWSSSLESALRVINWSICLHFLKAAGNDFEERNRESLRRWIASVHEHLSFINGHFSRYSSANNHLIGEAAGLLIGSLCFGFPESPQWASRAQRVLEEESEKQHWPDGVNKEQALSYQSFVFDFLLLAGLSARSAGRDFSGSYWQRLERMAEYVASLIDENGEVPHIGDEDDGFVVVLSHEPEFRLFRSLLATAATLFDRGDFRAKAKRFDEKSFWLLGPSGVEKFASASRWPPARTVFPDGGYVILTGSDARVIFDCGPLGYLSLAAHGHADALSIILDYRGTPFFVDPGTYAYHTKKEWRNYMRGTSAHNTVRIDQQNQSEIAGNFMWQSKARCTLTGYGDQFARGEHDGYQRLKNPIVHERRVAFDADARVLGVEDLFRGKGRHSIEMFFHLHPASRVEESRTGFLIRHNDASIHVAPDEKVGQRHVYLGSSEPRSGWYSPGYDRIVPCPTLVFEAEMAPPASFKTTIKFLP